MNDRPNVLAITRGTKEYAILLIEERMAKKGLYYIPGVAVALVAEILTYHAFDIADWEGRPAPDGKTKPGMSLNDFHKMIDAAIEDAKEEHGFDTVAVAAQVAASLDFTLLGKERCAISFALESGRREHLMRVKQLERRLLDAALTGSLEDVKAAIEDGANINAKDAPGATALIFAAGEGFKEIVEFLLEMDVDVDAKDNLGTTALSAAAMGNHGGVVSILKWRDGEYLEKRRLREETREDEKAA